MAEALAAIGIAASVVQLVSFGSKVLVRLDEIEASAERMPQVFSDIRAMLPLLLETVEKTQEQAELGNVSAETKNALLPVINGCYRQVKDLEDLMGKVYVNSADSAWKRGRKAVISISLEKKAQAAMDSLANFVQVLTLYQAAHRPGMAQQVYAEVADTEPVFTVPFQRDLGFIPRPEIMDKISARLDGHDRVALAGIGGVGKTQIATEYCYRWREKFPSTHIFWIHASTASRFHQSCKSAARKLDLPGWDDQKKDVSELLRDWLSKTAGWLMILDNADDLDLMFGPPTLSSRQGRLCDYLPRRQDCATIITTRDTRVASRLQDGGEPIAIEPMTNHDAKLLLESKLGTNRKLVDTETLELVDVLGHVPLAITQAATFMIENSIAPSEYLDIFRAGQSEAEELLNEEMIDQRRDVESASSVLNTLKLSFDQIAKRKPLAAEMLSLMAFLDRNGIPKRLLKRENAKTVDFVSALGTLQSFSLIKADPRRESFEMHRLVQLSMRSWLRESPGKWQAQVLELLSKRFPSGVFDTWKECEELLPHAQAALSYETLSEAHLLDRANLLAKLSRYHFEASHYKTAEEYCLELVSIRDKILGPHHLDSVSSKSLLGEVYFRRGTYDLAEPILRQAMDDYSKLLCPASEQALNNTGVLAQVVHGLGRFEQAEALYKLVIQANEGANSLQPRHYFDIADNLAAVLRDQRKWEESEYWIRKALEGREQLLGPTHLATVKSINHLALVLSLVGGSRLDEAEAYSRRCVAAAEVSIGRTHHWYFISIHTLGKIQRLEGQYESAQELCTKALQGLQEVLGVRDRGTIRCELTLGQIAEDCGHLVEAQRIITEVVEANMEVMGAGHVETASSIKDLERVREKLRRASAATEKG